MTFYSIRCVLVFLKVKNSEISFSLKYVLIKGDIVQSLKVLTEKSVNLLKFTIGLIILKQVTNKKMNRSILRK